jgi:hypothetical protein
MELSDPAILPADQEEVSKMRALAKQCGDLPVVSAYVKKMTSNLKLLFESIYKPAELLKKKEFLYRPLDKDFDRVTGLPNALSTAGSVRQVDLDEVLTNGNIREQMTVFMLLGEKGCDLFGDVTRTYLKNAASLPAYVSKPNLDRHIENFDKVFGVTREDLTTIEKCGIVFPCAPLQSFHPFETPLVLSRYAGVPWQLNNGTTNAATRIPRDYNVRSSLKPTALAIYPPLSAREKMLMVSAVSSPRNPSEPEPSAKVDMMKKIDGIPQDPALPLPWESDRTKRLPWETGYMWYSRNPNSFFGCLCTHFNEFTFCGPSGACDMVMSGMSLFTEFNAELATLACISWMGMPPDHSCVEILIAAVPYGLTYKLSKDKTSHDFVRELIAKYSSAPVDQPKATGGSNQRRTTYRRQKVKHV